jgi:hypothetical protein
MNLLQLSVLLLATAAACGADNLRLAWTNNLLSISGEHLPGGSVEIWYLEAFCRSGSTGRDWNQTTIPHRTEAIGAYRDSRELRLRTQVEPSVIIDHEIRAGSGDVEFRLRIRNSGSLPVDVQWFQPCMRVQRFTGLQQSNYINSSFIFTAAGLTMLDKTRRTEEAIYRGGQVYVPEGINLNDVNPRPISPEKPINGLIGCLSADKKYLLATAWDQTQELFQGVIVCLHNDPRFGGLHAGETKTLRGKVYIMENNPDALLARYRRDFRIR